jgi:hypothetical protein
LRNSRSNRSLARIVPRGIRLENRKSNSFFGGLKRNSFSAYDVSAEGRRFLAPPAQSTEQVLTVVQNWTAGPKK